MQPLEPIVPAENTIEAIVNASNEALDEVLLDLQNYFDSIPTPRDLTPEQLSIEIAEFWEWFDQAQNLSGTLQFICIDATTQLKETVRTANVPSYNILQRGWVQLYHQATQLTEATLLSLEGVASHHERNEAEEDGQDAGAFLLSLPTQANDAEGKDKNGKAVLLPLTSLTVAQMQRDLHWLAITLKSTLFLAEVVTEICLDSVEIWGGDLQDFTLELKLCLDQAERTADYFGRYAKAHPTAVLTQEELELYIKKTKESEEHAETLLQVINSKDDKIHGLEAVNTELESESLRVKASNDKLSMQNKAFLPVVKRFKALNENKRSRTTRDIAERLETNDFDGIGYRLHKLAREKKIAPKKSQEHWLLTEREFEISCLACEELRGKQVPQKKKKR